MERPIEQGASARETSADPISNSDTPQGTPPLRESDSGPSPPQSIIVREHSAILYWWPVWAVGFLCAILSFAFGERIEIGDQAMWFHPSRNLGIIYIAVFAVVFVRTNVVLRGVVSLLVILGVVIGLLLLSLFGWWQIFFALEQGFSVHMDAGFYMAISSVIFAAWSLTIFVFDRFAYCEFRPGQLVVHKVIGGGIRTCDTRGISVYKAQVDMFRHWGLGLGTGDLHIATAGAESITLDLRNVTFVDQKLASIKRLVAMSPDEPSDAS